MKSLAFSTFLFILLCITVTGSFANTITGTITDEQSFPVPGVTIQIQGTSIGAISDVKGNYVIIDVPAGDHTLLVSSIGFKRIVKNISIKGNQTKKYDFSLEESAEELAEVVVRGQSESEIKKAAPIQIESIRLSTVVEQIKDLNDALITMPGVRIQSSGSLGDRSEISLNGLTGQAVRSYVDGLPFEFLYPTLTITNIPLNTVERIDIYKGVVPVDIGTDALAGAVNVVTNRKISNAIEGFYSFGSFNTHQAGISGSYQLNKKLSFQVNTAYNYSDNDYKIKAPVLVEIDELNTERVEREVRRFNDAYELKFADISLSLINTRVFDFAKITIGYSDYFKEVNNSLRITDSPWGEYEFSGEVVLTNLQLEKEFNDRVSLQSNTAYSFSSIETVDTTRREYVWDGSFEIGSAGENGDNPTLANRKNNNILNRTSLTFKFFEEDELLFSNIAAYQDIFGRDELRSFESDLLTKKQSIFKNVLGLQYTKRIKKLTLNGAAKFYYFSLEGVNNARNPLTKQDQELGYYFASKYNFSDNLFVRSSFERGYRIPNLGEFFGDGIFIIQNPALTPERSDNINFEVGYKSGSESAIRWGLEANGFYRNTEDLIFLLALEVNPLFVNQKSVNTRGIETEGYVFLGSKLKLTNNFTRFRQTIEELSSDGDDFLLGTDNPNTPNFIVFSQLEYFEDDLFEAGDRLRLYLQYYFVDEFNHQFVAARFNPDNWVDTQNRVNLGFTYSLPENRWSVSGNVFNVLDAELFDNFAVPRPGRNYNIRLAYRLNNF